MRENDAKPMRATSVVHARVLRHNGYRAGLRRNSQTSANAVTMKWRLPEEKFQNATNPCAGSRAEAVAHPRIHEVHDQDVDDLAPPPQAPAHPHVVLFLDRNLPHTARQLAKNRWPHKHQVVDLRTVTVGDVELNLAEAGVGGRPFLLLHGFTGAKEDFTDYVDRLAEQGWHVVAPDHRGHGDSAKPDDEAAYGFSVFASDALGLADALGWDQFVVLGPW